MREGFIQEEIKKGNTDVRAKMARIDMLQPLSEGDALSTLERRKDRSISKSKSPDNRKTPMMGSPSKQSIAPY